MSEASSGKDDALLSIAENEGNVDVINSFSRVMNVEDETELIVDMIAEAVRNETTLDEVMKQIEERYEYDLSVRERHFVENIYVEKCEGEFMDKVELHIEENIEEISKDLSNFLDIFEGKSEIPDSFSKIKHFSSLNDVKSGRSYARRKYFIETLKIYCVSVLERKIKAFNAELDFINETKCVLRKIFVGVTSGNSKEISESEIELVESFTNESELNITPVQSYMQYLKQSTCPIFEKLRGGALALGRDDDFVLLPRELSSIFSEFNSAPIVETKSDSNGEVLIYKGSFIRISNLKDKLEQNMYVCNIYEVQIVATQILNIDADLNLPGINLILVSPEVFVCGKRALYLSGTHGEKLKVGKAKDGEESGSHGTAGETGNSGRAGGNAVMYTRLITYDHNLTIKSHGGNGSNGQDGGNGADGANGKDGYDMTQSEFDQMYPKRTTFWKFVGNQVIDTYFVGIGLIPALVIKNVYPDGLYYELTTEKGCRVICSLFTDRWYTTPIAWLGYPKLQAYCIHYGAPGEEGGQGGMGGKGGNGGRGGFYGSVRIICGEHNVSVEKRNGIAGERGKDGRGGNGGYNGRRGLDTARVEPSQYSYNRSYELSRLELHYDVTDSHDAAYCPHESSLRGASRYAKIKVVKSEEGKTRAYGERSEKNEMKVNTARDERQHEISVPISTNAIVNMYKHVVDNQVHVPLERPDISLLKTKAVQKSSKTYTRTAPAYALEYPSIEHIPLRTISIKRSTCTEVKDEFTIEESPCDIQIIIDEVETMTKGLKCKTDTDLKQAIDSISAIEKSLTKIPFKFHDLEALLHLLDSLSKYLAGQTYYHRLNTWKKGQTKFSDVLNLRVENLEVISLQKYKFARLAMFAAVVREREAAHYNRSEKACRGRVISIVKMRLIHLYYELVEGLWRLHKIDVPEFVETFMHKVNHDLSHVCNTLNSFERQINIKNSQEEVDCKKDDKRQTTIEAGSDEKKECATQCHEETTSKIDEFVMQSKETYCKDESHTRVRKSAHGIGALETQKKESHFTSQCSRQHPQIVQPSSEYRKKSFGKLKHRPKTLSNTTDDIGHEDQSSGGLEVITQMQKEQRQRKYKVIKTFEDAIKRKDDQRYLTALESLKMLQYVDGRHAELLLELLTAKILVDGFHLSSDLFLWFISRILTQTDAQSLMIFVWIISTVPMEHWLAEYMVMQAIYQGYLAVEREATLREHLCNIKDIRWLPVLWKYLCDDEEVFSNDDIITQVFAAFSQLEEEPYDEGLMLSLRNTDPSNWNEILLDYNSYRCLLKLSAEWTEDELAEADAYVDELRNTHGDKIVNQLLECFTYSKNLTPTEIMHFLRNIYYEAWPFTAESLKKIENEPVERWEVALGGTDSFVTERSLEDLIQLMERGGDNSPGLFCSDDANLGDRKSFDLARILDQTISDEGKIAQTFGDEFRIHWANEFDETIKQMNDTEKDQCKRLVREWADKFRAKVKYLTVNEREEFLVENITEVFAHVEVGLSLICGFKMRQTQRLATILLVKSNFTGLLEQVSTGEGKTIIIVLFCVIKNLIGHSVDVITCSPVLAERDASQNAEAFALFGVSVSCNCSENIETSAEAYKKDIVYGEIGSFQRDILLQRFYSKNTRGKRGFDIIVVDEVDSMLLDKAENILYLSHDVSDLDALEPVFVFIWSFVHGKGLVGSDEDITLVHEAMRSAIYGAIRKKDLEDKLDSLPEIQCISDTIMQLLRNAKVLDEKGRICRLSEIKSDQIELGLNEKLKLDTDFDTDGAVLNFLKDASRQGIQVIVPHYLEQFIDLHLTDWIKSAFLARFMEEKRNYLIDIDKSDTEIGKSANVVIIDVDTGVEQCNMQWSNGLHQFLQLKHGCRVSVESLKAVFMSNVTFFKLYEGSVYGLTGTLGSRQERELLKSFYNVDYVNIPTFCRKRFLHHEGLLYDNGDEWIEKSVEAAVSVATQRPVLMVCETIQDLEKFQMKFLTLQKTNKFELYVYKSSYEELDIVKDGREIQKGCVILATNLAGRGTDIKISDCMDQKGGLHVILTYLPRNTRITEQAFGRTARKGQKGSGQFCIMNPNITIKGQSSIAAIMKMTEERNAQEKERLKLVVQHCQSTIKVEESYFGKFEEIYAKFKDSVDADKVSEKEIILGACLDSWAFWLDSLGKILATHKDDPEAHWEKFETLMEKMVSLPPAMTIKSPSLRVKLAKVHMESRKYTEAMEVFQKVITDEPNFSESAHYYYAHCVIQSTGLSSYDDTLLLILHLLKAEEGLKKKIAVFSELTSIVNSIKTLYGNDIEHFVLNDDYERQKCDVINILSVYCDSVRNVLGHGVDENSIMNVSQDVALTGRIIANEALFQAPRFNELLRDADREKETMEKFMEEQMKKLLQRYELYSHELASRIDLLQRRSDCNITEDDFKNILPSREEFWCELNNSSLLFDEEECIIIDKEKVESSTVYHEKFLQENMRKLNDHSSNDLQNLFSHTNDVGREKDINKEKRGSAQSNAILVCMFPEYTDDIIRGNYIAIRCRDYHLLNEEFRKILKTCGAVYSNKIAFLNVEDAKVRTLAKYDGISERNFCEIEGISDTTAKEIYSQLIVSGVLKSMPPLINEVKLSRHKRFESEVKNLLRKYYAYRIMLQNTIDDGAFPYEQLTSKPNTLIWKDLMELNIITPLFVKETIDEEKAQIIIDEQSKLIEAWNTVGYFLGLRNVTSLATAINEWKAGLFKYKSPDSFLKDIQDMLDDKIKRDASAELVLLSNKGLDHILVLQEEKWTWTTICKIAGIVVLGMAQIALGVVIEVFTLGTGTFVAAGLIEEGVGDIMFAIECAFSGHCSVKEYLQHKVISVVFTVMTAGVGAFFARGAQFSRFGYKIAGKELMKTTGKELIKETGKRQLAKECAKLAGKKMAKGVAMGAATCGIDMAVECLLRENLKDMCNDVLRAFESNETNIEMCHCIDKLCKKFGPKRTREIVHKVGMDFLKSEESEFVNGALKISEVVSSGIGDALKKLGKSKHTKNTCPQVLSAIASLLSRLAEYAPYVRAVNEMKNKYQRYNEVIPKQLQEKLDTTDASAYETEKYDESESNNILLKLRDDLTKHVNEILTNKLLKPLLKHHAQEMIMSMGKSITKKYRNAQTYKQRKDFDRFKRSVQTQNREEIGVHYDDKSRKSLKEHIISDYHSSLVQLQKKVRNPDLYADILREGVPMGIHETQAICDLVRRPIHVVVCGGDGRKTLPEKFKPSALLNSSSSPLVVYFHAHADHSVGHFSNSPNFDIEVRSSNSSGRNNCLLDTVSTMVGKQISRDSVAHIVQHDPITRDRIQRGIHRHYTEIGGIGGVLRTAIRTAKIAQQAQQLLQGKSIKPREWRDPAKLAGKFGSVVYNTGNHELFQVSEAKEWAKRTQSDTVQRPYTWIDLFVHFRVDTSFVVFDYHDGKSHSMQGHPVVVFRDPCDPMKTQKTKGSPGFHDKISEKILQCKTPEDAARVALRSHLDTIGNKALFESRHQSNPAYFSSTFTATGHDLSNHQQRHEFLTGLERERFKIKVIHEHLPKLVQPSITCQYPSPGTDYYRENILKDVQQTKSLEEVGKILMSPAPYGDKS